MKTMMIFAAITACLWFTTACAQEGGAEENPLSSNALAELLEKKPDGFSLVDVRTKEEYAAGHIPGALNIPLDTIADNPPTKDKDALIVLYCRSGNRSGKARKILLDMGYRRVINFGWVGNWEGELMQGDQPK